MSDSTAIKVANVSKDFVLPHEKVTSIKSAFVSFYKRRSRHSKETQHALRDVSFEIKKGEFFGIVGRNGSGKSTLLKILAGIYQPTSGSVEVHGKLVPFIELGVGFNPELTGRENVFLNGALLGFSESEVAAMYDDIVAFAELERFMDQKLKNYSSGMQVRLAFSVAVRADADILLIDEVLAVGDADFQRKCFEYFHMLKSRGKTVVFVGHDMQAIREYCDRGVLIDDGKKQLGGTGGAIANAYSRMFINEERKKADGGAETAKKHGDRRGTGEVAFERIVLEPASVVTDEEPMVKLLTTLTAKVEVERLVVGFKIKNSADVLLLGTNTTLAGKEIKRMKKGESLAIEWTVPNIFNDGNYGVDVAIESAEGKVYDWREEAVTFKVLRSARTGFVVAPSIRIKVLKP